MGNKCKKICQSPVNESSLSLQAKSEKPWVRKMELGKSQKIIVALGDDNRQEQAYFALHDNQDYLKGITFTENGFYEGQIDQNHMACGQGLQRFHLDDKEGQFEGFYEGNFSENARNGHGTYKDPFVKFEGQWKNGYPVSGTFENSQISQSKGPKAHKYIAQQLVFNNPEMSTGTATLILPDKSKYIGQFARQKGNKYALEGRGILYIVNSDKFDGEFKDGKFHGQGVYTWAASNRKFEGEYRAGLKNGQGRLYVNKHKYMEGKWAKGKKDGKFAVVEEQQNGTTKIIDQFLFKDDELQILSKIPH